MNQRIKFIEEMLAGELPFNKLCEKYEISEKTGYKWRKRFFEDGFKGLQDRSRAPKSNPNKVPTDMVCKIINIKQAHQHWGARKIRTILLREHYEDEVPSESTVHRILDQSGFVEHKKRRKVNPNNGKSLMKLVKPQAPNDVWAIDFKGWWRSSGEVCEPFNIIDLYSRKILCSVLVESRSTETISNVMTDVFKKYGLPKVIRSDNGTSFAAKSNVMNLTKLSVWWITLGILPDRTKPGAPYQNGAIERLHLDMAKQIEGKYEGGIEFNQIIVDEWVKEYNSVRPHEALDYKTPDDLYRVSERKYKEYEESVYPFGYEKRRVTKNGDIKLNGNYIKISTALSGVDVGLLPTNDKYMVYLTELLIGEIDPSLDCFRSIEEL